MIGGNLAFEMGKMGSQPIRMKPLWQFVWGLVQGFGYVKVSEFEKFFFVCPRLSLVAPSSHILSEWYNNYWLYRATLVIEMGTHKIMGQSGGSL